MYSYSAFSSYHYDGTDHSGNRVTLRICPNEPGGEVIEMGVTADEDVVYPAFTKKQARKLALALLSWSEER